MTIRPENCGGGLRIARLKNRVYHDGEGPLQVSSHAEYGILDGTTVRARIVRNGSKWIALQITEDNKFGKPVSPMNYVLLRDVKEWALERFTK